ncbi:STAS domain-containing protein [Elusimicrobiota bacterium]
MEMTEEMRGQDSVILDIKGRFDATTAAAAESKLLALIEGGCNHIVVDFAGLEYISSAGLRSLLICAKRLKAKNGDLCLCCLIKDVKDVFDISGFSSIFTLYPTREEALATLRS